MSFTPTREADGHDDDAGVGVTTIGPVVVNPSGTSSVNMTDVRSIEFGFSMVIVSVVLSAVAMVVAKKSFVTIGGATTTVWADAEVTDGTEDVNVMGPLTLVPGSEPSMSTVYSHVVKAGMVAFDTLIVVVDF